MIATIQKTPPTTDKRQFLPAGYDGGNGASKLNVDGAETLIPALIQPLHNDIYDVPESKHGALIEYVSGDRPDLIGKRWLAGESAYIYNPTGCLKVVDDKLGKVNFGLQLLLAALGTLTHRQEWKLSLAASIQDARAFGTDLEQALVGRHTIRINNSTALTHVCNEISGLYEEGSGAIAHAISSNVIAPNTQVITFDPGFGTCITSVFAAKGKLINRKVSPGGVSNLIEAIAKSIDTRRQLKEEGDRQLIRQGIERGDFLYGKTGWNFRSVYNTELAPWVQSVLAPALKAVQPWKSNTDAILAIGGGSQLPAISQLLVSQGITPISGGAWANARGLTRLAQLKLRRAA
jgi:hypothetical protein